MPKYHRRHIAERSAPSQATALHIFDFDDTLYDSPRQPKSWEGTEREWWRSPASLSPPHLPAGTERQRMMPSAQVAKASIRNPKVHAILLSGRADDPGMRMRMESLLKTLGLTFDGIYLKDSGNTEQYKARVVETLLQQMPSVQMVAMWDDLARNLNAVEKVAAAEGLGFQRNLIRNSYSFAEQRQACFDATSARRHGNSPESSPNLSERTMSFFADFNRMAHGRQLPTLEEAATADMVLTESDARAYLHSLMEAVGYDLAEYSLEESLEIVAEFMESDEFAALSEEERSKLKQGFKMVFGKLRKIKEFGKAVAADVKRMGVKRVAGEIGDYVRSGEAKKDAKRALGRAANKTMDKLDKATGRRISKGMEKVGAAADKVSKGKFTKAMTKRASDAYDKRSAEDAKVKAYYKKSADKQAAKFRADYEKNKAQAAKKEDRNVHMSSRLTEEDDQIGMTIVKQMGGAGRLKMMIGAKLLLMPKGLKITFPNRQRSKGNSVVITLEPSDTYKMEFFNGAKSVKVYDDVYADKLKEIFETQTGLYLSL